MSQSAGSPYSANQPPLAAWVQNTLTDSFLEAHQTFCRPLEQSEADQFVQEQSKIGALLGVVELPKPQQTYVLGSLITLPSQNHKLSNKHGISYATHP